MSAIIETLAIIYLVGVVLGLLCNIGYFVMFRLKRPRPALEHIIEFLTSSFLIMVFSWYGVVLIVISTYNTLKDENT